MTQVLLDMLQLPLEEDEHFVILLQIALLSSVHHSTVEYLEDYLKHLNHTNQVILFYATLGRHGNVENRITNTLAKELEKAKKVFQLTNDSTYIIHIIHALGNTGSKKIIPLLLPLIHSNQSSLLAPTIDALRTVSHDEKVQKAFTSLVKYSSIVETVIEVVESLIFPFKQSIYFSDHPDNAGERSTEKELMSVLVESAIKFKNVDLNKLMANYLNFIDTQYAKELLNKLQTSIRRSKRESTTNWNDGYYKYNLIASQFSRTSDEENYPYHRAYLWVDELGVSKLHAKVAAGGFGGLGSSGYKVFARAIVELYAWGYTYRAVDVKYLSRQNILSGITVKYGKICGSTYINQDTSNLLPYLYSKAWNLVSLRLFVLRMSFFIYVGTLDITLSGSLSGTMTFDMSLDFKHAECSLNIGPTVTITGDASVKLLVSQINFSTC